MNAFEGLQKVQRKSYYEKLSAFQSFLAPRAPPCTFQTSWNPLALAAVLRLSDTPLWYKFLDLLPPHHLSPQSFLSVSCILLAALHCSL